MSTFRIYAALHEYSQKGEVWISFICKEKFIQIKNPKNNKSIITLKRKIDSSFSRRYNRTKGTLNLKGGEKTLVINDHYRRKLKIDTKGKAELEVHGVDSIGGTVHQIWHHPNPTNRIILITLFAAVISIITFVLTKIFGLNFLN